MPNTVYVCDLDPAATELQLWDVFNQVGYVASVRVCRDTATGLSLGFGYVNYVDGEAAARAVSQLNLGNIAGKPCRVMWAHRDRETGSTPPTADTPDILQETMQSPSLFTHSLTPTKFFLLHLRVKLTTWRRQQHTSHPFYISLPFPEVGSCGPRSARHFLGIRLCGIHIRLRRQNRHQREKWFHSKWQRAFCTNNSEKNKSLSKCWDSHLPIKRAGSAPVTKF
ncbi:polyadenylate binding protein [Pelomyxa schiedti]|nr:polyadenylate binding protein [Pelomyxa schiedti]